MLSIDLADLGALQKKNRDVLYLLVCVHVFSRCTCILNHKNEKTEKTVKTFSKILEKPIARGYTRIFSYRQKEFYNKEVQSFLGKKKKKKHYIAFALRRLKQVFVKEEFAL